MGDRDVQETPTRPRTNSGGSSASSLFRMIGGAIKGTPPPKKSVEDLEAQLSAMQVLRRRGAIRAASRVWQSRERGTEKSQLTSERHTELEVDLG